MQPYLIAGDTLRFTTSLADYPASAGWVLKYRLVPRSSGTPLSTITATASGDDHLVAVSATTTALWTVGEYSWAAWVEKDGESITVEQGTLTVKPDPRVVTTYDGRSQAQKALDDANAAYATYMATNGAVMEYEIAGRRVRYRNAAEIQTAINHWSIEVQREAAQLSAASGRPSPRRYLLRFGRA